MTQQTQADAGEPPTGDELDALLARALGVAPGATRRGPTYDPPPTPVPARRGSDRPGSERAARARLLGGVALLGLLGAGYLLLGTLGSDGPGAAAPTEAPRSSGPASSVPGRAPGDGLAERLPGSLAARCRPAPGLDPVAHDAAVCTPGGRVVRLELRAFTSVDALRARYRAVAGGEHGARGAPRCARGEPEERAWAAPVAPRRPQGRYVCRLEGGEGAAALWWTSEGTLVMGHAVAPDDDLAALFAWWRAAPESVVAPGPAS